MGTVRGEHLQVVHFPGNLWFGNSIKKLPDSWLSTGAHLFGRSKGHDVALVNQKHAVGDQKCACELVCNHDDRHAEGALELQDQLVDTCRDDWVQPCVGLI